MLNSQSIKVGDVVGIPAGDGRFATAQVLIRQRPQVMIAIFAALRSNADPVDLAESEVVFVTETVDLHIRNERWPFLGNYPLSPNVVLPEFRVAIGPDGSKFYRQDAYGNIHEELTAKEQKRLRDRTSYSPLAVEEGLASWHGNAPWNALYDAMTVQ